jgi:hypothetical protein
VGPSGPTTQVSAAFPLKVYKAERPVTAAELGALSSAPVTFLEGVPGHVIVPIYGLAVREAGDAYTLNSVTSLNLRWVDGSGTIAMDWATAGLIDGTAEAKSMYTNGPGSASSAYIRFTATLTSTFTGAPLVVAKTAGTDVSGGTGSVTFTVWYLLFPMN